MENTEVKKSGKGKVIAIVILSILLVISMFSCAANSGRAGRVEKENEALIAELEKYTTVVNEIKEVTVESEAETTAEVEEAIDKVETTKAIIPTREYQVLEENFYARDNLGETVIDGYIAVKNTGNSPLEFDVSVDLENNAGELLGTEDWFTCSPHIIYPGEIGYIRPFTYIEVNDKFNGEFNTLIKYDVKTPLTEIHEYPLSDLAVNTSGWWFKVTGRIINDTDKELNYVYIDLIGFNKDGKAIGFGGTNITDVMPGDKMSFEAGLIDMEEGYSIDDVVDYKIIARD